MISNLAKGGFTDAPKTFVEDLPREPRKQKKKRPTSLVSEEFEVRILSVLRIVRTTFTVWIYFPAICNFFFGHIEGGKNVCIVFFTIVSVGVKTVF